MGDNMYIEVSDRCMYHCATCPKGGKLVGCRETVVTSKEVAEQICEARKTRKINSLTLSGGEPLLNPNIYEIVKCVDQSGCRMTMLSNSYLASNKGVAEKLRESSKKLSIVTAIHSHLPEVHDQITGVTGSLSKTLDGITHFLDVGIPVRIKIILCEQSCRDLLGIFDLVTKRFRKTVRIELCGMDLCGMTLKEKKAHPLNFEYQADMVEKFLTQAENFYGKELVHFVNISEYPLCRVDPYFWECVSKSRTQLSSHIKREGLVTREYLEKEHTCFPHSNRCNQCVVKSMCPGIWFSVYEYLGDSIVIPYQK